MKPLIPTPMSIYTTWYATSRGANRRERHNGVRRTPSMTENQRHITPPNNTRQRGTAQRYVSQTPTTNPSNYTTPHDNAVNRVPRHNTYPNTTQHHSQQHNTTQHNTVTRRPPQNHGIATPNHTTRHNPTELHGTKTEHNPNNENTTPHNAETEHTTTSWTPRKTNPQQTTKQQYAITQRNMLYNATNRQVTTHNTV